MPGAVSAAHATRRRRRVLPARRDAPASRRPGRRGNGLPEGKRGWALAAAGPRVDPARARSGRRRRHRDAKGARRSPGRVPKERCAARIRRGHARGRRHRGRAQRRRRARCGRRRAPQLVHWRVSCIGSRLRAGGRGQSASGHRATSRRARSMDAAGRAVRNRENQVDDRARLPRDGRRGFGWDGVRSCAKRAQEARRLIPTSARARRPSEVFPRERWRSSGWWRPESRIAPSPQTSSSPRRLWRGT